MLNTSQVHQAKWLPSYMAKFSREQIPGITHRTAHDPRYIKLLLWPVFLCYDYSMDAVPLVESLQDARLLLPCAAYLGFVLCGCGLARLGWGAG